MRGSTSDGGPERGGRPRRLEAAPVGVDGEDHRGGGDDPGFPCAQGVGEERATGVGELGVTPDRLEGRLVDAHVRRTARERHERRGPRLHERAAVERGEAGALGRRAVGHIAGHEDGRVPRAARELLGGGAPQRGDPPRERRWRARREAHARQRRKHRLRGAGRVVAHRPEGRQEDAEAIPRGGRRPVGEEGADGLRERELLGLADVAERPRRLDALGRAVLVGGEHAGEVGGRVAGPPQHAYGEDPGGARTRQRCAGHGPDAPREVGAGRRVDPTKRVEGGVEGGRPLRRVEERRRRLDRHRPAVGRDARRARRRRLHWCRPRGPGAHGGSARRARPRTGRAPARSPPSGRARLRALRLRRTRGAPRARGRGRLRVLRRTRRDRGAAQATVVASSSSSARRSGAASSSRMRANARAARRRMAGSRLPWASVGTSRARRRSSARSMRRGSATTRGSDAASSESPAAGAAAREQAHITRPSRMHRRGQPHRTLLMDARRRSRRAPPIAGSLPSRLHPAKHALAREPPRPRVRACPPGLGHGDSGGVDSLRAEEGERTR